MPVVTLLNSVSEISNKFNEEAKKTGENFNVFSILGLTTNEVRTHTAFLKELLHPKGSHGQGDIFLKLFLEILKIEKFDLKDVEVYKEYATGFINDDYTEGGNLDILIYNGQQQCIVIENKIYAADQKNQLLRYYNFCKEKYPKNLPVLIYLTLDGRDPSMHSTDGLNFELTKLSYQDDIINWLEKCLQINCHSIVKETIQQYLHLIQSLTNKSKTSMMKNEVLKLISSDVDSFNSAKLIVDSYNNLIKNIIPQNTDRAILCLWNEKFHTPKESVVLFSFDNYEFRIAISNEVNWHFQIAPWRKDADKIVFGVANDDKIHFLKDLLKSPDFDTFQNNNYTMWYYSKFLFDNISLTEYLELINPESAKIWSQKVIAESVEIIKNIILKLKNSSHSQDIIWNESNPLIKEYLSNNK